MADTSDERRRLIEDSATQELAQRLSPLFNDIDDYDSDDDTSFEADVFASDAQKHWDESMRQLDQALFFVLFPVIGRIIGRRFAKSMWVRFVDWRWQLAQRRGVLASKSVS